MTAKLRHALTLLPLFLLPLGACTREKTEPAAGASQTAPVAAPTAKDPVPAGAAQTDAAPIGPITSRGTNVDAVPAQGSGIAFDVPANWQQQTPDSQMRIAQAIIPGSGGNGQLAVFFFGPGGGGGVEANIERWIGQMEPEKGANPQPQTFQTPAGYKVTWVDVPGTIKPSTMGTGPDTAQPDSRLLGAVVEGPGGPWFFKATGPDATIVGGREAFLTMLKGVHAK